MRADHHPAHVIHHGFAVLVCPARADPDHTRLAIGVLFQPDHFGFRPQRVPGINRCQPSTLRIAKIGHRIQRDVRHRFAKDNVKRSPILNRALAKTARTRKFIRRIKRMPRRVERMIQRPFPPRYGAWHRVIDHLTDGIIFEKPARIGLGHCHCSPSFRSGL